MRTPAAETSIVEGPEAEGDRQQIEEAIISGEGDEEL